MELIRQRQRSFLGAFPDEIAILRNATECNNLVAQGIDLKAGDEVLIGYLEHDSNRQPWLMKAKRQGIVVKEVAIETPPSSPDEILHAFEAAITPRTRAIATRIAIRDRRLCPDQGAGQARQGQRAALLRGRRAGAWHDPVNVHDLGVDTYATTCHKWLCSPAGTGLLYVRREMQERIWPNIVTEAWWSQKDARKYEAVSRRPWPVVAALEDAIDFQNAVGRDRIEYRIRALNTYFRSRAAEIPHVKLYTSNDPRLSGAMTSLGMDNVSPLKLREYLRQRFDVYTANGPRASNIRRSARRGRNRISLHYYNTFEQVERVLQGLRELSSGKA